LTKFGASALRPATRSSIRVDAIAAEDVVGSTAREIEATGGTGEDRLTLDGAASTHYALTFMTVAVPISFPVALRDRSRPSTIEPEPAA
jgi:hypothetical protein